MRSVETNESTCSSIEILCSNYSAKVQTLEITVNKVNNITSHGQQVIFLTGAMSVLQVLTSDKLPDLKRTITTVNLNTNHPTVAYPEMKDHMCWLKKEQIEAKYNNKTP